MDSISLDCLHFGRVRQRITELGFTLDAEPYRNDRINLSRQFE
jgi:hypothetical protein